VTKQCEILQRHDALPATSSLPESNDQVTNQQPTSHNETVYTISFTFDATGSKKFVMEGVPRSEIFFEHKKYASDQFLENAFRHVIDIPDDIFPVMWKDLENVQQK